MATNLESFNKGLLIPDDTYATIVLDSKSIDPAGTDDNAVSLGWGLIHGATSADYSQGKTSEKLTKDARYQMIKRGKDLLLENGVYYDDGSDTMITAGAQW